MRFPRLAQHTNVADSGNVDTWVDVVAQSASMAAPLVWTVRRDWPAGDHEFVGARPSRAAALRLLESDRAYWRRGPMRPTLSVALMSRHDFTLHDRARQGCRAPDCPIAD
jgi:hypothetical protein